MRKRLGVMCSGNGTNFENIVRSCKEHEVVLMIYNTKGCGATKRAAKLGIPNAYFPSSDEDGIINELNWARVDYIVLAGWMRILSETFVEEFSNRIINVHPSLLPKYKGLHAVEQAMRSGDKETGCTVHYVNSELDGGEIIKQARVPIFENDTVRELTKRIQREEYRILPEVIDKLP
tara:strand:- start:65 stop:595 length:531 start_codon:yes stop_codon:yes gene_type:complete